MNIHTYTPKVIGKFWTHNVDEQDFGHHLIQCLTMRKERNPGSHLSIYQKAQGEVCSYWWNNVVLKAIVHQACSRIRHYRCHYQTMMTCFRPSCLHDDTNCLVCVSRSTDNNSSLGVVSPARKWMKFPETTITSTSLKPDTVLISEAFPGRTILRGSNLKMVLAEMNWLTKTLQPYPSHLLNKYRHLTLPLTWLGVG